MGRKPQETRGESPKAAKVKRPAPRMQPFKGIRPPPPKRLVPVIEIPSKPARRQRLESSEAEAGPSKRRRVASPEPWDRYQAENKTAAAHRALLEIQDEFSAFLADARRCLEEAASGRKSKGSRSMGEGKERV